MADNVIMSNGHQIPQVALGTSRIKAKNLEKCIKLALEIGYRHIDTACLYGNEEAIGKALQEYFEATNLKRDEVFITTKLSPHCMTKGAVGPALDESLMRLRLEYVDLFLIHHPCALKNLDKYTETGTEQGELMPVDLRDIWKAMEETVYQGKARSIGVSSFNSKQLDYILQISRIPPTVNQVEAHARFPQKKLQAFCKSRNIKLEAFAPLGSPNFNGPAPLNWVQSTDDLVDNAVITELAKKYQRSSAQILLRNLVQRGIIVIPKSENPQRMKENLQVFSFYLSEEDMKRIDELENGERRFCFQWSKDHPEHPCNEEF